MSRNTHLRTTRTSNGYSAVLESHYDGTPSALIGTGKTRENACADLQTQLHDEYAPLTVPEDEEPRDRRDERERLMSELGLRERDFR